MKVRLMEGALKNKELMRNREFKAEKEKVQEGGDEERDIFYRGHSNKEKV